MKAFVTKHFLLLVIVAAIVFALAMKATIFQQATVHDAPMTKPSASFRQYWLSGKAELNRYRLEQAQYGTLNAGDAVLIFVTEDFRTDLHVKAETPDSRDKAVAVLKTNLVKCTNRPQPNPVCDFFPCCSYFFQLPVRLTKTNRPRPTTLRSRSFFWTKPVL